MRTWPCSVLSYHSKIQTVESTLMLVALAHRTADVVCTFKREIQKVVPKYLLWQWWFSRFNRWMHAWFSQHIQITTKNFTIKDQTKSQCFHATERTEGIRMSTYVTNASTIIQSSRVTTIHLSQEISIYIAWQSDLMLNSLLNLQVLLVRRLKAYQAKGVELCAGVEKLILTQMELTVPFLVCASNMGFYCQHTHK